MGTEECPPSVASDSKLLRRLMPAVVPSDGPCRLSARPEDGTTPPNPNPQRCGLIQCRKLHCTLNSHKQFVALRRAAVRGKKQKDADCSSDVPRPQFRHDLLGHSVARIERLIENGFPALPFKFETSPIFKELAHHYFSNQIDRLIQQFSPHLDRQTYKSTMMEHALSNDVFCICITANAKTDMLSRANVRSPDRASEIVYAATAHILRQKLTNFKPTEIDWLLVLVVALVGFDLAFQRQSALRGHHEALKQLITMKGGVHTLGHTLFYVTSTDRFLALFTGEYPMFRQTPLLSRLPQRDGPANPYGAAFSLLKKGACLDQPVIEYCREQCELIHLIETSHISFDPKEPAALDPSALPYYMYSRDRLYAKGTCLHADYHENQNTGSRSGDHDSHTTNERYDRTISKSRCALLATILIEYTVAHGNYYTIKGPFLASQLKSVLDRQPCDEWNTQPDMLAWILFVLAAIPEHWEHHVWAVSTLRQWLDTKFYGKWASTHRKDSTLAILKQHIWAQSLDKTFLRTYTELVGRDKKRQG